MLRERGRTGPYKALKTRAYRSVLLHAQLWPSSKKVLGVLIDHHNLRTGQCNPSLARLSLLTGCDRRTVMRARNQLRELGLIVWDDGVGGRGLSSRYTIDFEQLGMEAHQYESVNSKQGRSDRSGLSANAAGKGGQGQSETGAARSQNGGMGAPRIPIEHHEQQIRGKSEADVRRATQGIHVTLLRGQGALPYAEIIECMDVTLEREAAMAEIDKPGAGLQTILRAVLLRRARRLPETCPSLSNNTR